MEKPILAVDVDGVISLFGFDNLPDRTVADYKLVDGILHCISRAAGPRLMRLAEHFELIWATGWEERANEHLPHILGLPEELPHLTFERASFGTSHWKLDALGEYAGDRPLAWIDDCIDAECEHWAESRDAPTLLVHTDPMHGIEELHVDTLIDWAKSLPQGRNVS